MQVIKLSDSKTCTMHDIMDNEGYTVGHVIITEDSAIGTCVNNYEKEVVEILNGINRPLKSFYAAEHVEILEIEAAVD